MLRYHVVHLDLTSYAVTGIQSTGVISEGVAVVLLSLLLTATAAKLFVKICYVHPALGRACTSLTCFISNLRMVGSLSY
jgi:hypothetical protein